MRIRIGIVDDNRDLLEEYAATLALEPDFLVVGCYDTIESALRELPRVRPDVVLMDIRFRLEDQREDQSEHLGIDCTRALKAELPNTAILMLTVVEDDENISAAICNGAVGYVLKQAKKKDLIAAIREVVAGGSPMIPSGIARKLVRWVQQAHPVRPELDSLSERELSVLRLIAQGQRDVDIARKLEISQETVGTYLRRAFAKLQVHTRTEAVAKFLASANHPDKKTARKRKSK